MRFAVQRLVVLVVGFSYSIAWAADKTPIAILDFEAIENSQAASVTSAELMRVECARNPRLTVVERSRVEEILKEQAFQKSGCTTDQCAVEIGKLLNVSKMVLGKLGRLGSTYVLSCRLVNVERGQVEWADEVRCDREETLADAAKLLAGYLSSHLPAKGRIIGIEGSSVVTNVGAADGYAEKQRLRVVRKGKTTKDAEGNLVFQEQEALGVLEIRQIDQTGSQCRILNQAHPLQVGDEVIGELERSVEERTTFRGAVKVQSWPTDANVFVDGVPKGKTPLLIGFLAPGTHRVKVEILDHKPSEKDAEVKSGTVVLQDLFLEPMKIKSLEAKAIPNQLKTGAELEEERKGNEVLSRLFWGAVITVVAFLWH